MKGSRPARCWLPVAFLAVLALMLGACSPSAPGGDRPQIVVTTNILGDVVRNVVGDSAEVTVLMKPNADPHSFEISAQEAARMHAADLIVTNGLGLEEGLQQHVDQAAASGAAMFVAGEQIEPIAYTDDAAGGADDPHFWTDPARMIEVVEALTDEVVSLEGIDDEAVRATAASYLADLRALDAEMTERFGQIPRERRALVTNHHVFGYLAERFDFEVIGAVIPGGTTLASPSAADLRDLADAIELAGVPVIFAESSQPDRLVQVLASEVGVDVEVVELFTESLTEAGAGAGTYLEMMRENTSRIAAQLSP